MQVDSSDKIRNLAIAGHSGTGKTTLASALLYTSGVVNRLTKTEDGGTTTDFDEEEIHRGISIGVAPCAVPWNQHKLNLLDCPGYAMFLTDTEAAIRATDAMLLCVDGASGVEVVTEKVWDYAAEIAQPVLINLTKMDRERATLDGALASLQERFGREVMPIQLPIGSEHDFSGVIDLVSGKAYNYDLDGAGKAGPTDVPEEMADEVEEWRNKLIEMVAESSEELLEKYFEEGDLSQEDLISGLRRAIRRRRLFPVTLSSLAHGRGNSALLDAIVDLMPTPLERAPFPATNIGGEDLEIEPDANGPMAALVFKTLSDPFAGKITLLRVVSGEIAGDATTWNTRAEQSERLGGVHVMQGKTGSTIPKLVTGDIGGVSKLKHAQTGDTLCDKNRPIHLGWIHVAEPAITFAIEPKSKGDEEKIGDALHRLQEEDLALKAGRDPETGEFLLSGQGQLHVEITVAKLHNRFHVDVVLHPPRIPYRETIRRKANGHGRHKKQSGGRGQFADCKITVEPLAHGEDFEFVDEIFGGSIPQSYRPAVEKGIQEARARGFLAGYKMVDFKVRLTDGKYHDVDSSELAFKIAGSLAFKDAVAKAAPTLMEPMMKIEVTVDEEVMGDIMSDLSQRRGRPQGVEANGSTQTVTAIVPMAEMLSYAPALNSITQGKGSFHMEFSSYEEMPANVAQKVVEAANRKKEED
ncbi:MAG: elongation factor G [Acidobacteria bacterium]|nr:elongation factor G [Acidobacteriota bacterium]